VRQKGCASINRSPWDWQRGVPELEIPPRWEFTTLLGQPRSISPQTEAIPRRCRKQDNELLAITESTKSVHLIYSNWPLWVACTHSVAPTPPPFTMIPYVADSRIADSLALPV